MFFMYLIYSDAFGLGELLPGPVARAAKQAIAALDPLSVAGITLREGLLAEGEWPVPDGSPADLVTAYVAARAGHAIKASKADLSVASRYLSLLKVGDTLNAIRSGAIPVEEEE
jgi:hypothetical protein